MAGYTRQSTYTDGDIIQASDSNDEFDQLLAAFNNSTGHKHDGTAAEGPVIGLIGDPGVTTPINKVVIDDTNNRVGVFVDVSSSSVEQIRFQDGVIVPVTNNDIDLGTSSLKFKDAYFAGNVSVDGNITLGGTITLGDGDTDNINLNAEVNSHVIPNTDDTFDLGSATKEWRNLYIDGTANIDSLVADTADINGGTIDAAVIGGTTAAAGSFTTIAASSTASITGNTTVGGTLGVTGTTTLGTANITSATITSADINGGTLDGVTIGSATAAAGSFTTIAASGNVTLSADLTVSGNTTIGNAATDTVTITADVASNVIPSSDDTYDLGASGSEWKDLYIDGVAYIDTLTIGTSTGVTSVDTDLSSVSASDDTLASAKAIKAYVDAQVTAQDLDLTTDSGTIAIDLDSEVLTVAGGTGIDSSATGSTVTLAIDSTVTTLTGTQTLTNKTLTAPVIDLSTVTSSGDLAVADGGTGASTAAAARTNLDVDQAGTALALAIALG